MGNMNRAWPAGQQLDWQNCLAADVGMARYPRDKLCRVACHADLTIIGSTLLSAVLPLQLLSFPWRLFVAHVLRIVHEQHEDG